MNTIQRIALLGVVFVGVSSECCSQKPPDSLLAKVILFQKWDYDAKSKKNSEWWQSPEATGFFLDTGSVKMGYIVTAKHVPQSITSPKGISLHYRTGWGMEMSWFLHSVQSFLLHPDSLIDIAMIDQNSFAVDAYAKMPVGGFNVKDVLTKSEFEKIQIGDSLFFIGMYPDSLTAKKNWYWFPQGKMAGIFLTPKICYDPAKKKEFKVDFCAQCAGAPGISGSPVLVKRDSCFKVVGIVNAIDPTTRNMIFCTAGYRIAEVLKERWEPVKKAQAD